MCDYGMLASGYSSKVGPTERPMEPEIIIRGDQALVRSRRSLHAGMLAQLSLGADIVGSIRNPASFAKLIWS